MINARPICFYRDSLQLTDNAKYNEVSLDSKLKWDRLDLHALI